MSGSSQLILVDGSSYLYRAFHAMPSLANSKGFPTGAVYGVINMLRRLLNDYQPEYIAVVFDAKGKTFRDDLYEQYKANRSAMPDDLTRQIEPIHAIIKAMGIPIVMIEGVEADDVIGTLAKQAEQKHVATLVSTSDKDLAQLVNSHVTLVNTMSDHVLNPITVKEKFGIPPDLIVDYLTLVGDTVDNIPGVPQVGPKTAVKWLLEYGSLDNIVKNAEKITGKVGENLRQSLHQLPLAKQLASIKMDVPLDFNYAELQKKNPDNHFLIEKFKELEFRNWLSELLLSENTRENKTESKIHKTAYAIILTETALKNLIQTLQENKVFSFSLITTQTHIIDAEIIGIGIAYKSGVAVYIPIKHEENLSEKQLSLETVLSLLKPLLENKEILKLNHDIKNTTQILVNYDIHLQGTEYDTLLLSYILESSSNAQEIDALSLKYLGKRTVSFEDLVGKGAKQISFTQIPIAQAATHAAEVADVTLQLHETLWPKVKSEKGLQFIFEKIEMPLTTVLARIERNGVLIDADKLDKQTIELEKRIKELEIETIRLAGVPFNLSSPKQLQEILFDRLKLPVLQKTPTGQPSTAEAVLQELALDYELPKLIIEHRSLCKLMTTYTKKLPEQINKRTGRVHTTYHQTGAITGRLSSSDPNLQNIPVRTLEGRRIRQAIIAPKGYKIIAADYSQIELRIMAHISGDETLLNAFEKNLDIHQATAAEVLGVPLDKVTNEQRRSAKAINFGLIYGMSAFGLAKNLNISRDEAQHYIEKYFARYPKVREYMENTRKLAHAKGFVETLWGRRLPLPEINSSQMMRQKAAERAAINAPLQGSAADIIKMAMISVDQWLQQNEIDAKMIMQVHDELVFEVAEKDVPFAMEKISELMTNAAQLKTRLDVSIGAGDNWDAASE